MKCTVLSLLMFVTLASSLKINCIYKSDGWPTTGLAYYCYATNLEVPSQDDFIEEITGTHMNGKSDSDVNAIWIEKSPKLLFMPRGFEYFYEGLTAISINDSGMKKLSSEDLQPFPKLEGIWFYSNKLTTFSNDVFQYNPLLRHIDFSNNRIRSIPAGILDPLEKPKVVRFHGNVCIHKDVTNYEVNEMVREIVKECAQKDGETSAVGQCDCEKLLHENTILKMKNEKMLEEFMNLRGAQNILNEVRTK